MTTRRDFIYSTVLGAAAASSIPSLLKANAPAETAASKTSSSPGSILVDWHSHWVSPSEVRLLRARTKAPRLFDNAQGVQVMENLPTASSAANQPSPWLLSDIETRIRHLDSVGVQRQLLSYTVANGYDATLPVEDIRPFFRALNDDLGALVRKYPDHFLGVAALPTGDPVWAAQELERAHRELGLIGGALPLNAFASLEGAKTLAPIFNVGQKFRSHFFIHRAPANPSVPGQPPIVIPEDTGRLRWSIISNSHLANGAITLGLTDFLDPWPDVTVQIVMLGGFLPYLLDGGLTDLSGKATVKDSVKSLRRIFFDPGPYSRNGKWVALAAATLGADRILFGTDYGVGGGTRGDIAPAIKTLDEALTTEQKRLIYVENSRSLLAAKGVSV